MNGTGFMSDVHLTYRQNFFELKHFILHRLLLHHPEHSHASEKRLGTFGSYSSFFFLYMEEIKGRPALTAENSLINCYSEVTGFPCFSSCSSSMDIPSSKAYIVVSDSS